MGLTRRQVLWMAAGSAALLSSEAVVAQNRVGVSVLLEGDNCLARESAAGYRRGLESLGCPVEIVPDVLSLEFGTIVVPACGALQARTACMLRAKAEAGHYVVLESGLAFVDVREAERQSSLLEESFGLSIDPFVSIPAGGTLYLRYRWPASAIVRQFGAPVAVSGAQWRSIAHFRGFSVAAVRPIGSGKVTFLGSPLGPMLLAEDREAKWLAQQLLTATAEPSGMPQNLVRLVGFF